MGKAMGYFLGFFLGGIIITLAVNLLFFNRHKATDEEISAFQANTVILEDNIKKEYYKSKFDLDHEGYDLGPNLMFFKQYYSRSGGGVPLIIFSFIILPAIKDILVCFRQGREPELRTEYTIWIIFYL